MGIFDIVTDIVKLPVRVGIDVVRLPQRIVEGEDDLFPSTNRGLDELENDLDD